MYIYLFIISILYLCIWFVCIEWYHVIQQGFRYAHLHVRARRTNASPRDCRFNPAESAATVKTSSSWSDSVPDMFDPQQDAKQIQTDPNSNWILWPSIGGMFWAPEVTNQEAIRSAEKCNSQHREQCHHHWNQGTEFHTTWAAVAAVATEWHRKWHNKINESGFPLCAPGWANLGQGSNCRWLHSVPTHGSFNIFNNFRGLKIWQISEPRNLLKFRHRSQPLQCWGWLFLKRLAHAICRTKASASRSVDAKTKGLWPESTRSGAKRGTDGNRTAKSFKLQNSVIACTLW